MKDVVIISAARTPVGSFLGSFANTPAHELGAAVLEALVERAGIEKGEVPSTSCLAMPESLQPEGRRACRSRRMWRICARAGKWAT